MELVHGQDQDIRYYSLDAYLSYVEDFQDTNSIEHILGNDRWIKNTSGKPLNFGFVNYPVWIRFPTNLELTEGKAWYLVIPYPLLQHVDVYLVSSDQQILWHESLDSANRNSETLLSHQINFSLPALIDKGSFIYLKASSSTSLQVPLELWDREYLIIQQNIETLLWGLYFGIMLALVLYNSFLFISLRDTTYIYYVFTLASVMVLMLSISGFGNRYVWHSNDVTTFALPISASMASFWLLCFCISFLKAENINVWIRMAMKALAVLSLGLIYFVLRLPDKGALTAGWLGTITIALVLMAGTSSLLSGQVIARYFVLATACFGLGSLIYLANVFGLFPSSRITNHSIQAGSVLEALLFSFALAHRFKEERRQKLIAMEQMEQAQRTIVQVQDQALQQALHDPVSGKPNEYLLSHRVNQLIADKTNTDAFALVLISFPQIKQIASSMGRRLAKEVFESVIATLEKSLDHNDQAIAVEPETKNFVAVENFGSLAFLCKTGEIYCSINEFVGHLIRQYDSAIQVGEITIQLDACTGISVYPKHGDRAELLLQHASAAQDYGSRSSEKLTVYSSEIDAFGRRRLALVGALSQAVNDKELKLYLQPQFDCITQQMTGAEVLLRWSSQQFGVVSPVEFIEVAEEAGLMNRITRYLVAESFAILSRFEFNQRPFKLSINLSTQNLIEPDFVPFVVMTAEEYDINLADVVFEVTETYLSEDMSAIIHTLEALGAAGCCISLDDYGTGYSSLMYLSQLPVNELKIDKSFVSQTERHENDYRIVENTVKLARALQIETVAEGVENFQTLMSLMKLGCDRVQGFYFAKPMPASQFQEWVEHKAG